MFRFFKLKKWFLWSWLGSFIILSSLWVQVKIDVKINEWFGEFYDMIQKALSKPNSITMQEYWDSLFSFISLAGLYVSVYVIMIFLLHIIYLDGEQQWLSGIILFMIKRAKLKEQHKEFKRTQLNSHA